MNRPSHQRRLILTRGPLSTLGLPKSESNVSSPKQVHYLNLEMIVLHFNMQGEDIMEHTNDKCHVLTFSCARETFFSILMPSVICVH